MTKLVIRPQAMLELDSAVRGYELEVRGLGRRFKRSMKATLRIIRRHPEAYALALESFRAAPVRRFPYVVLYDVDDAGVTVFAVFHTARDADSLRGRRTSG